MDAAQYEELLNLRRIQEIEDKLKEHENAAAGITWQGNAKAIGSGAVEGPIAATVGLGGDLDTLGQAIGKKMQGWLPQTADMEKQREVLEKYPVNKKGSGLPTTKDISEYIGTDYEPKNALEGYLKRGTSGLTGAVATPMRAMSWAARGLTGLLGGGMAEGAKQAGWGPGAEIAASMLPWVGTGAVTSLTPQAVKAISHNVKAVGEPAIMEAAKERLRGRQTLGEEMLLTQGFPEENALTGTAKAIAAEPAGQRLGAVVGKQGSSARDLALSLVDRMSKRDMGPAGATETQRGGRQAFLAAEQSLDPDAPTAALRALFGPTQTVKGKGKQAGKTFLKPEHGDYDTLIGKSGKLTADDITEVGGALRNVDPEALPSIIKSQAQKSLDKSQKSGNWLQSFTDDMIGRSPLMPTREKFTSKMTQIAESQGKAPREVSRYVKEATDLMESIQMASRNREFMGSVNATNLLQSAGRNPVSETMRAANVIAPLWRTGSAIERRVAQETLEKITEALIRPGGEQMLLDIARFGAFDHKAKALILSLIASRGGAGTAGQ